MRSNVINILISNYFRAEASHFVYLLKIIGSNEKESLISFVEFAFRDAQKHQISNKVRQRGTLEFIKNLQVHYRLSYCYLLVIEIIKRNQGDAGDCQCKL